MSEVKTQMFACDAGEDTQGTFVCNGRRVLAIGSVEAGSARLFDLGVDTYPPYTTMIPTPLGSYVVVISTPAPADKPATFGTTTVLEASEAEILTAEEAPKAKPTKAKTTKKAEVTAIKEAWESSPTDLSPTQPPDKKATGWDWNWDNNDAVIDNWNGGNA